MLRVKNIILYAAPVCGLFIISAAAPQKASANFIPPGSYQKTCQNVSANGADLTAACKPKDSSSASPVSKIYNYFECDGDISNNNGKLTCNRNSNSALMQKAKAAIDNGYHLTFDGGTDNVFMEAGYRNELIKMFKLGFAEQFYTDLLGFDSGGKTAIGYYFDQLNAPENAGLKQKTVNFAFMDVYGTGVSPKDLIFYNAQKTAYRYIYRDEKDKLQKDAVLKRLAISYAYKKSMGRTQRKDETDYWFPLPATCKEIVEANRSFMYSDNPKGKEDLDQTIKSHLLDKGIDKPSPEQIKAKRDEFIKRKAIYVEMF